MSGTWRRGSGAACAVATAALIAMVNSGCTAHPAGREAQHGPRRAGLAACAHGPCARPAPRASHPTATAPIWLYSLHMVSARDGWALAWTSNPNSPRPAALIPVRTTDGGRTWIAVTPTGARRLLAPNNSEVTLQPRSARQAWLAVTLTRSQGAYGIRPARTVVFGTVDGGRTWTQSATIRAPGYAHWLAFTDPAHGWLVQDLGAAMNQNPVRIYRTGDGGRRWSLIAASPHWNQAGTNPSGLPIACDKTGIAFAAHADGWLTSDCFSLADGVLATRDGGVHWRPQALPVPASACSGGVCTASPPQFFGPDGFLTIEHGGTAPYLLVSRDTGATWHAVPVPRAAGRFGAAQFFDARHGLLVPAVTEQDSPGRVFYVTSDGGGAWSPVRQGMRFRPGTAVDFTSPETGFAWNSSDPGVPPIYATTNGGRTWTRYRPRLIPAAPPRPRHGVLG